MRNPISRVENKTGSSFKIAKPLSTCHNVTESWEEQEGRGGGGGG